ncbi:MAG: cellulosome protein dockerin type I [Xylanivirga thermophila]|jgi:glucuronoarabinoxylan endo-1,4-beta-xylanase|uniref:glycoside hydrolase family 30 protein n=1 Tax=Xylanivirga thermophila TaxID=2496273 RepID=UPI0039F49F4E
MDTRYKVFRWIICIMAILIVILSLPFNSACACTDNRVVIEWNNEHQKIDGFGVSQAADIYAKELYDFSERKKVMDLLFSQSKGIGLSILRCEVGNGLNMPTIEPEDGVWDFSGDDAELWVINEAKKRGVDKIFSTVWSPPAWMKTNNRIQRGGFLKKECYQKYADYLAQYVKGYKQYHDVDIYAVSIANEPEYAAQWQSCLWTGSMMEDFIGNYLKPTFERENVETKVIAGEMGINWNESVVIPALKSANACSMVDIVGGHYYRGIIKPFFVANAKGKKVWLTETSDTGTPFKTDIEDGLSWAKTIHKFMSSAEANAFCYWLGASYKDTNEMLIKMDKDNNQYIVSKRFYTLGNYSKFIRPEYIRIETTKNPIKGIYTTAYKNPKTDELIIVAINETDREYNIDFNLQGFSPKIIKSYVTNQEKNLKRQPMKLIKNEEFTVQLGEKSVTTFLVKGSSIDY